MPQQMYRKMSYVKARNRKAGARAAHMRVAGGAPGRNLAKCTHARTSLIIANGTRFPTQPIRNTFDYLFG